jgi:hypothetical protein
MTATETPNYYAILLEAQEAARKAAPVRVYGGCGRVYLSVPKLHAKGIGKAAKKLGMIYQGKSYYGTSNALYVGYDNADGLANGRGNAMLAVLTAHGIDAYLDLQSD